MSYLTLQDRWAQALRDGPRTRTVYRTTIWGRDRAKRRILIGAKGTLGLSMMWLDDRGDYFAPGDHLTAEMKDGYLFDWVTHPRPPPLRPGARPAQRAHSIHRIGQAWAWAGVA
jgi:hypothetical protein